MQFVFLWLAFSLSIMSAMLFNVASFLLLSSLNNISVCIQCILKFYYLSFYLWIFILFSFSILLWIIFLRTWRYAFKILFSVLWDIDPKVGLLDRTIVLFLSFEKPPYCSSYQRHELTFPPYIQGFQCFHTGDTKYVRFASRFMFFCMWISSFLHHLLNQLPLFPLSKISWFYICLSVYF